LRGLLSAMWYTSDVTATHNHARRLCADRMPRPACFGHCSRRTPPRLTGSGVAPSPGRRGHATCSLAERSDFRPGYAGFLDPAGDIRESPRSFKRLRSRGGVRPKISATACSARRRSRRTGAR